MTQRQPADRAVEIRRFFLYPRPRYTFGDLARIWQVSIETVAAMFSDELDEAHRTGADLLTFEVDAASALSATKASQVFRPIEIEEALGEEFERVLPEHCRTIPLTVHLPQFLVDTLAEFPFLDEPSLEVRAERLLCEFLDTTRMLRNKDTR